MIRKAIASTAVLLLFATPSQERERAPSTAMRIDNVVVIYAENRSFDNLYGTFPGANGIPGVNPTAIGEYTPQTDRDAANSPLATLPRTWGGVTARGQLPVVTQEQSANLPNRPFPLATAFGVTLPDSIITHDLVHQFFENQMQINGGRNDKFAAYSDAGGLTMSYYPAGSPAMWKLAQEFVLADNFFMGAFGGSYLNHQYLICACAPEYPNADKADPGPSIAKLKVDADGKLLPSLLVAPRSEKSASDGPPAFEAGGAVAPKNYFGDGTFRTINTMLPPYQPSPIPPADDDPTHLYAYTKTPITLPPQTIQTIGDTLSAKGVKWKWYAGGWDETVAGVMNGHKLGSFGAGAVPNFQFHHQAFNYYARFDPVKHADERREHFKDLKDLESDIANNSLPAVAFYKPQGNLNQHSGYTSIIAGDQHIADLVDKLRHSKQWEHMLIVITYDENGGLWDHVAPPKGDLLGPGTRIPALIISPYAKRGFIDHTQYDTGSIARLLTMRFGLAPLAGTVKRDTALKANGAAPMGDLANALAPQ